MAATSRETVEGATSDTSVSIVPAHGDAIRIVPLHHPGNEIASTTPPHLTYRDGPLLSSVEVFTVFWGAAWQGGAQLNMANKVNQFFTYILTSSLIDQLSEYSVPAHPIRHGKYIGSITITKPRLGHSVTDSAIQHMLHQEVSTNSSFPKPSANMLYFVYLPPNVKVIQGGGASCQVFCGYHNDINGQIFYAAMPYPGCSGCIGGLAPLDALTSTSSHELCEAITDPVPGVGWYDDVHGEIGDICAWKTKQLGSFTVQLEWSNASNACK
jgi:hypothetical protein